MIFLGETVLYLLSLFWGMDTLKEKKIRFSEIAGRQEMLFMLLRRDLTSYKVGDTGKPGL